MSICPSPLCFWRSRPLCVCVGSLCFLQQSKEKRMEAQWDCWFVPATTRPGCDPTVDLKEIRWDRLQRPHVTPSFGVVIKENDWLSFLCWWVQHCCCCGFLVLFRASGCDHTKPENITFHRNPGDTEADLIRGFSLSMSSTPLSLVSPSGCSWQWDVWTITHQSNRAGDSWREPAATVCTVRCPNLRPAGTGYSLYDTPIGQVAHWKTNNEWFPEGV